MSSRATRLHTLNQRHFPRPPLPPHLFRLLCAPSVFSVSSVLNEPPTVRNAPGATRTRDLPLRRRLDDSGTADGAEPCNDASEAPSDSPGSLQRAIDPADDRALVTQAWSSLSDGMRQAIVALVRASMNSTQDVASDRTLPRGFDATRREGSHASRSHLDTR